MYPFRAQLQLIKKLQCTEIPNVLESMKMLAKNAVHKTLSICKSAHFRLLTLVPNVSPHTPRCFHIPPLQQSLSVLLFKTKILRKQTPGME